MTDENATEPTAGVLSVGLCVDSQSSVIEIAATGRVFMAERLLRVACETIDMLEGGELDGISCMASYQTRMRALGVLDLEAGRELSYPPFSPHMPKFIVKRRMFDAAKIDGVPILSMHSVIELSEKNLTHFLSCGSCKIFALTNCQKIADRFIGVDAKRSPLLDFFGLNPFLAAAAHPAKIFMRPQETRRNRGECHSFDHAPSARVATHPFMTIPQRQP